MTDRDILIDLVVEVKLLRKEWTAFELLRRLVEVADTGTVLDLNKGSYPVSLIVKQMRELVRGEEG